MIRELDFDLRSQTTLFIVIVAVVIITFRNELDGERLAGTALLATLPHDLSAIVDVIGLLTHIQRHG